MSSTENPKPEVYGPKCGGHDAMSDAHKCRQQQNQQQTAMAKSGGAGCKVISPQASGGVEVNSPHNNASNANGLTESLNQSRENAKYDDGVGDRNVDNSAGAGGGRKKRTTKKHRKRRASQKSRRRKVYVGCNKRSRNRMGGKTKRLSGWGCMSGGKRKTKKRKTKKGGSFFSRLNPFENKKEKEEKLAKQKAEEQAEKYAFEGREIERKFKLAKLHEKEREKQREEQRIKLRHFEGGKRKTRKFKKHYMWNTKGKRYMAKTYKQHLRGKKLGHTHTKPKKKSKKMRKTRRTRRRGGNMTPGSPEYIAELERRKRDRAQTTGVQLQWNFPNTLCGIHMKFGIMLATH